MTLLTITGCVVASIIHVAVGPLVQAAVDVNTIPKFDCLGQCDVFVSVKVKHEACLSGCFKVHQCLYDVGKKSEVTQDVCVLNCTHGCDERYEKFSPQMWACRVGCSVPERLISAGKLPEQDYIDSDFLSDGLEEAYTNATDPVGIVHESTQNISLSLGGVVKTDIKSTSLLTPEQVDNEKAISEKNRQAAKNISIDVQGLIGNVSKIHEAVTDYGEEGASIPEEKNKEEAENISLAILGSINRTGYGTEVVTKVNTGEGKPRRIGVGRSFGKEISKITKPEGRTAVELKPEVGKTGEGKEKGEEKGKGKGKEKSGKKGKGKEKGEEKVKGEVKAVAKGKVEKAGEKGKEEGKGKEKKGKGKEKGEKKGMGKGGKKGEEAKPGEAAKPGEKGKEKEKAGEKGKGKGKEKGEKKGEKAKPGEKGKKEEKAGEKGKGKKGKEKGEKKGVEKAGEKGKGKEKGKKAEGKAGGALPPGKTPAVGPAPAVKPK